jgi:RND family efflux transporter MFP subunit
VAQQDRLQIDLTDSELKSPFDGTIVNRLADEGDLLNSQQPVFEILETGNLEAHIGVPSRLLSALAGRDYFILTANDVEFAGTLRNVIAQVDPATRTQKVVLSVNDVPTVHVADGQLVRMKFAETIAVNGFEIPLTALAAGTRGLWTVYVVEESVDVGRTDYVVQSRAVEVLHTNGESAVIRGAVYPGELLVVGVHRVGPGQRVRPTLPQVREQE